MNFLSSIKDAVIFILIVGVIFYGLPAILSVVFNTPYPMAAISSNSMWPVLEKGDLILAKGAEKGDVGVGDIVIYEREEGFVIHRVVDLGDDNLTTKGDANTALDAPVKYDKIVGKTVNFGDGPVAIPYLGNITAFANR